MPIIICGKESTAPGPERTLDDKCARCKSQWGLKWETCQRCGFNTTVNEQIANAGKRVVERSAEPKSAAGRRVEILGRRA